MEFAHYDYKLRGTISAKDFALSMVASADLSQLGRLLDRADELNNAPHLRDMRITFEEFKNFAELRKKLQPFSLALSSFGKVHGLLTKNDFQRAASHVRYFSLFPFLFHFISFMGVNFFSRILLCFFIELFMQYQVCGVSLSDNMVEIIFHMFDTNRDGNLSSDEFVRVLHKRERDIAQPMEEGVLGFFSCCRNYGNNCSFSRLLS